MSTPSSRTVITIHIADEEYTIRADATPEYTRECAAYVDHMITEILEQGSIVHSHRAAILAALAITDRLFRAERELEAIRAELAGLAGRLASDIEARLGQPDLAARS